MPSTAAADQENLAAAEGASASAHCAPPSSAAEGHARKLLLAAGTAIAGLLFNESFALLFWPMMAVLVMELQRRQRMAREALAAHSAAVLELLAVLPRCGMRAHGSDAAALGAEACDWIEEQQSAA